MEPGGLSAAAEAKFSKLELVCVSHRLAGFAYQMLATLLFRPLDFDVGGPLHAVKHVDSSGRAFALWVSDVSLVHKCGVQSAPPALVLFGGSGCFHDQMIK